MWAGSCKSLTNATKNVYYCSTSKAHKRLYELNFKTNVCCIHNCLCSVEQDKLHSNMEKKSQDYMLCRNIDVYRNY